MAIKGSSVLSASKANYKKVDSNAQIAIPIGRS